MTSIEQRIADITLDKGQHDDPDDGLCLLEAVAYIQGLDHGDHPPCVSPVLGEFGRSINDTLPDDLRQDLKPLIPLLPGTAGDGHDETRGYMALDWLIRVYTPTWLELAGITEEASALRELGRIVDLAAAQRARPVVLAGRESARAARAAAGAAARAAAGAAAGAAAWAAAWDAAWAAAWDAARAAARAAAWAAARAAARAAAGDAAGDAARAAAGDAAGDAARAAAGDAARAAAGAAAGDAAGDAARAAAGAAAWDAAGDAAWAAAGAAAWAAAGDAAWAAAGAAAWDAAWDAAWAAARDAARAALAPTVTALQKSAIELYTAMATVGRATDAD